MHIKFYIHSFTNSWDIRGYPKNFGCHVTLAMPNFWKKIIPFCFSCPSENVRQILVYSFIRSKDITPNRMHVFACEIGWNAPKNRVLGGLGWENLVHLCWDPLGNQSPAKHVIWCIKNDGDVSPSVLYIELGKKSPKHKKNYISPLFQGSLLGRLL